MTLTLSIGNVAMLDNGMPTDFVLHRRGAIIGRGASCDWSLPDPRNHISSRHVEIAFDGSGYVLTDVSTNGTYLNGGATRLSGPRRIEHGDVFQIGHYEVRARLSGDAALAGSRRGDAPAAAEWRGWDDGLAPSPSPSASVSDAWATASPPAAAGAGWQPQIGPGLARPDAHRAPAVAAPPAGGGGWRETQAVTPRPVVSAWDMPGPAADAASGWSSAAPDRPPAPSPDDIWGRIADGNVVDWARGGFGQPVEPPRDPLGLAPVPAQNALPRTPPQMTPGEWGAPAAAPPPGSGAAEPPALRPTLPPAPSPEIDAAAFLAQLGLKPDELPGPPGAILERSGRLLRQLVAGLVVMVEARARAKAQLGAETTAFTPEGNNPIKFARTPDEAMTMLLGAPQRGFMEAERAVEDAFVDLQSHQMATIRAMQGALKATLDRFSPSAIRARADAGGVLERIVPAARDAALWQAYEREFGGVAHGSDEAFMDVFAKEFRLAYNAQARRDPS